MLKNFLLDIKYVFTNPKTIGEPITNKVPYYFFYFFATFFVLFLLNAFMLLLKKYFVVQFPSFKFSNLNFLSIIILTPLFEEFCFRAILKKGWINIVYLITGMFIVLLNCLNIKLNATIILIYFSGIILAFYIKSTFRCFKFINKSNEYSKNQVLVLVYFMSISFGIIHLINFEIYKGIFNFLIAYVFIKSLSGFLLSMLRLKFGLLYSIIFHSFINFLGFMFYMLDK